MQGTSHPLADLDKALRAPRLVPRTACRHVRRVLKLRAYQETWEVHGQPPGRREGLPGRLRQLARRHRASPEAQLETALRTLVRLDDLRHASDAQEEWHLNAPLAIEHCERLAHELRTDRSAVAFRHAADEALAGLARSLWPRTRSARTGGLALRSHPSPPKDPPPPGLEARLTSAAVHRRRAATLVPANATRADESPLLVPPTGHLVTIAPTGAGKTAGQIIPTALAWPGALVVLDPKGEVWATTARRRRAMGPVWRIDPFRVLEPAPSDGLNPFDLVNPFTVEEDCKTLAHHCHPGSRPGLEQDPDAFWVESAQQIIAGLLAHVACDRPPEDRTVREAEAIISLADHTRTTELYHRLQSRSLCSAARNAAGRLGTGGFDGENRTAHSLRISMQHQLSWTQGLAMGEAVDRTTVDLSHLERGECCTVYVTIPPERRREHRPLLRLVIGTLASLCLRRASRPEHGTLLLLDEASLLGGLAEIVELVTLSRAYGVQVWSFWQDVAQLERTYGVSAHGLLANADVISWFGGRAEATTAYLADRAVIGRPPRTETRRAHANFALRDGRIATGRLPWYYEDEYYAGAWDRNPLEDRAARSADRG